MAGKFYVKLRKTLFLSLMTQKLSLSEKFEIKAFLEIGWKQKEIAKKFLISQSTVLKKKINETGQLERKSGSGRPSLINSNDISYLKK